jgi:hypothetical protein
MPPGAIPPRSLIGCSRSPHQNCRGHPPAKPPQSGGIAPSASLQLSTASTAMEAMEAMQAVAAMEAVAVMEAMEAMQAMEAMEVVAAM